RRVTAASRIRPLRVLYGNPPYLVQPAQSLGEAGFDPLSRWAIVLCSGCIALSRSQKEIAFKLVLPRIEVVVPALRREQLMVAPALQDPSFFDHQDLIGTANRREAMRDYKSSAALHQI